MKKPGGFTLLELMIVLVLISLMLGLSAALFTKTTGKSSMDASARDIIAAVRNARVLARNNGSIQYMVFDLETRRYSLEGRSEKALGPGIGLKIIDPLQGEVITGKYRLTFHPGGGMEGGTIVLSDPNRRINIHMDPVIGAVEMKAES
ncbi:MAG: prepilin-type N-terminal cleavage/methylation domain-containing protein [Nitrospirae bacterium]|nr:MAG: prepilin-type N-terminal cleavage/methylation domain-containing protein [Nitrospirota bacterium]